VASPYKADAPLVPELSYNEKNRQARQLFRRSLAAPNENSVAQVEWANRQIGGLDIQDSRVFDVPRCFEVNAQVSSEKGEWALAIKHGINWLRDQPFSKRPAVFTSYVSSLVEEYARSIEILRASLRVNPNDPLLINNLAFALAGENRITEAQEVLRGTDYTNTTGTSAITLAATHGLVLFRTGFVDRGRELYRVAIERAGKFGVQRYRLLAELYLAREELLAKTPVSRATAERALAGASRSTEKDVSVVAVQIRKLLEKIISNGASPATRGA
jgi:tetratricopeptide (TPR) repeat protein